jgi:hypothetical protein
VADRENPDLVSPYCVYDSGLADAKFPVAFQGAPERDAHSMRIRRKALLDRSGDASPQVSRYGREIV